ncbi:hypothetical protein [Saccharospirillum mangrovi]|uniref:hypothetical protein n=1 Tax=Saccharospirillum mangrovi TaxID=2161747 RepID=UPI000D37BABF|nr:hypothetical protein [Saccharospirillum mangrovi]
MARADTTDATHLNAALDHFGFSEVTIDVAGDDVTYYINRNSGKAKHLVLFIQGTDPFPIFFYQSTANGLRFIKSFPDDDQRLNDDYRYAVVAKPGLSGIREWGHFEVPDEYQRANYRQRRIRDIVQVIAHIQQHELEPGGQIIVYGHSEGAQIAASLARNNDQITHLGFWSGNVLNNFYEFALFERLAALQGQQSDADAHQHIMELLDWYRSILADPESTELDDWGYTNRRWSSYRHAPSEDLLALDIPIYAQFATEDESTPIETAYLLPVQFLSAGKTNLDFHVCLGCDHSYVEPLAEGSIDHWPAVFDDFMHWTQSQPQ